MPYNGSGTFSIVNSFVANTTILSAAVNQNFTDIATGLSDVLTRDGQAGMTAVLKAISGAIGAPGIAFNSDATAGLYLSTTGIVGLVAKSLGILVNSSIYQVTAAAVQSGGSGYAVGDTITETGGTAITQAVLTVATLSGSAVATVTVTYGGFYTVKPADPVAQGSTSGSGSGATFNMTWSTQYTKSIVTDEAGALPWQRLGSSSFVSGLMALANGLDFVNGIGASNIASGLGLSAPPPGSSFKNLSIKVASNTTVTVAADFVVTTNGTKYQTTAVSSTINLGTTGINALDTGTIAIDTWYFIWVFVKSDGTTGCVASTSSTAPTPPSGYTYKARIGAVKTIHGSATLYGTWQFGRRAQYVVGLAQTTNAVACGSSSGVGWTAITVNGGNVQVSYVPSTASEIMVYAVNTNSTANAGLAPNGSYGAINSGNPPPIACGASGGGENCGGSLLLEAATIYVIGTAGTTNAYCLGWVDNL